MVIILEGTGIQVINGQPFRLHPGMVFLIKNEDWHAFKDCHGLLLFNILSYGDRLREWLSDLRSLPGYQFLFIVEPRFLGHEDYRPFFTLAHGELVQVRRLLETMESEFHHQEGGFGLAIQGMFFQLVTIIVRSYQTRDMSNSGKLNRISEALAKMQKDFTQPLSVSALARECNLSVRQFLRVFHQIQGTSPIKWLTHFRMEQAMVLLTRTTEPVTEIASQVGYPDPNYFSRLFRQVTGISPKEYRERHADSRS
jgi:AraC family L-rhamnose operon transcriptional activator RhaR/AraC family L-rhamnose operon regulatory protein RhaS